MCVCIVSQGLPVPMALKVDDDRSPSISIHTKISCF